MSVDRTNLAQPDRRRRLWWLLILLALAALIIYLAIPRPIDVEAARVRRGRLRLDLSSTGLVEAQLVDISPQITARIAELYLEEGQTVEIGQRVARLVDDDLAADVDRARAAFRTALREADAVSTAAASEEIASRATIRRTDAQLRAADARLRELTAGSRQEDIAAQRAAVSQVEAREWDARKADERAEALIVDGAISQADRDVARANYDAAQAATRAQREQLAKLIAGARTEQVDAARAEKAAAQAALAEAEAARGLAEARRKDAEAAALRAAQAKADIRRASAQLSYTLIRSSVRGVVARKHKEPGEVVTQLDPIYTLANLDRIWVIAEVDEENSAAVAPGQKVEITLDAYPGRVIRGRVVRVSGIAEPKEVGRVRAKIVRAKVALEPTVIALRPGMEVNVAGFLPASRRTLMVPNDAIARSGDEDFVYVVRGATARRRQVRLGQANFDFTQVLSGIAEGDTVALSNLDQLTDGARVRITGLRNGRGD